MPEDFLEHSCRATAMLSGLPEVLNAPLTEIASRTSRFLSEFLPHSALLMLTEHDVGNPRKQWGDADIISHVTFTDLKQIRQSLSTSQVMRVERVLAGQTYPLLIVLADTGAMLLLIDPGPYDRDDLVLSFWQILALRIQEDAKDASPTFLMASRAASSVRTEAVTELTDHHSATLESLLALLRSDQSDRGVRQAATNLTAEAMVHLRTTTDQVRDFVEEPVTTAFERLRDDLQPLVKFRDITVQFVEPPVDGRALPSEIAYGARAIVRGVVLTLVDQVHVARIRVQWDCDGTNLLISVRDDGPGGLTTDTLQFRTLRQRVLALNGQLTLEATEGWGTEISVVMPLDPPPAPPHNSSIEALTPREFEVLNQLATGHTNRVIAHHIGISENTVKFHVSKIYSKLKVSSRAEATALMFQEGSSRNR